MTGKDLLFEMEMAGNKDRAVKVAIQYQGISERILTVTEVNTGRENDNIYICVEEDVED